jgi:L-cysteine desulfidase
LKSYLGHAPTREEIGFYAWATAAAVGSACGLASYAFGGDRIQRFVHKVIGQVRGHRRT